MKKFMQKDLSKAPLVVNLASANDVAGNAEDRACNDVKPSAEIGK
jgi:hypothetical protein